MALLFRAYPDRFDEVHFGKFSSYYLRREFFFDVHPPLAKLILALGGYFIGFKGNFDFETIGLKYAEYGVPYTGLRATSAIFGALNVPLAFHILQESGYSLLPSTLATFFVLFGKHFYNWFPININYV